MKLRKSDSVRRALRAMGTHAFTVKCTPLTCIVVRRWKGSNLNCNHDTTRMPPRPRATCQICNTTESKYTCPNCLIVYCSATCFKGHTTTPCGTTKPNTRSISAAPIVLDEPDQTRSVSTRLGDASEDAPSNSVQLEEASLPVTAPLRPLTTLKWPNVPPPPAIPDPLTMNDPQPLQIPQYEAIATSRKVRELLVESDLLPKMLRSFDRLQGPARERALEAVLGVKASASHTDPRSPHFALGWLPKETTDEDLGRLRGFLELVGRTVDECPVKLTPPAGSGSQKPPSIADAATLDRNVSYDTWQGARVALEVEEHIAHD